MLASVHNYRHLIGPAEQSRLAAKAERGAKPSTVLMAELWTAASGRDLVTFVEGALTDCQPRHSSQSRAALTPSSRECAARSGCCCGRCRPHYRKRLANRVSDTSIVYLIMIG